MKFAVLLIVFVAILFVSTANGFLFSKGPKCAVAVFKGGKEFSGEKIMANKSFVPYLKTIGAVAKGCKVKVHVVDSYKQLKSPTEFVLSTQLPLALGRGIQFDLQDSTGGTLCNKLCMLSHSHKTLPAAKCFLDGVQNKGIKFTAPKTLDDGSVAKLSVTEANKLKVDVQTLCAPKQKAVKAPKVKTI